MRASSRLELVTLRVPFVDIALQDAALADELRAAIDTVTSRADFILGDEVAGFEAEFADYCGVAYAVGTDSGLSAITLGLLSLGVSSGDEVITAAHTFAATAFAITHTGATPVVVDINPANYTIDPLAVEQAITPRTKAIIPVHMYGHPADLDSLLEIARLHGLAVVEDASQAHGARYRSRPVGSWGDASAFSLYPSKNLGAYGDAGILVTNQADVADRARILRNYGQRRKNDNVVVGYNHRLDTLQAAVLRVKLRHLDHWNDRRRARAQLYNELLADTEAICPSVSLDVEHVWHLYVIEIEHRDTLRRFLDSHGIVTGVHYPRPIHLLPAYSGLGLRAGSLPISEAAAGRVLSLPMYPHLEPSAIEHVCLQIAEGQRVTQRRRARSGLRSPVRGSTATDVSSRPQ
jgi:dTDP-4-amino-4,6-dideoxygalactose transaminase